MEREIKFKIKVKSEKDYQRVENILRVHVGNLELSRLVEIVSLEQEEAFSSK